MKDTLYHPLVFVVAGLYLTVVVGNAGFHFYHGWAHADAERADALRAAAACRANPSIMKRHIEECKHDEADSRMNAAWFAVREMAERATLCPPVSCVKLLDGAVGSLGALGLYAMAAAAGAMVCVVLALRLFGQMRVPERGCRLDYGQSPARVTYEHYDQSHSNGNFESSANLRQRTPVICET